MRHGEPVPVDMDDHTLGELAESSFGGVEWAADPDGRACPHGDATCPCQDGDTCHYEGPDPMYCPLHQTTHSDTGDSQ